MRLDEAYKMACMAIVRVDPSQAKRLESLEALKAQIASARSRRDKLLVNCIKDLPIEIFTDIARLLVTESPGTVVRLSHVCSTWRSVVQRTPFLWDTLTVSKWRPKEKISLWIKCSQGQIRRLKIRANALEVYNWTGDDLRKLRWSELKILDVEQWDVVPYLTSIGQLPALGSIEELYINDLSFSKTGLQRQSTFSQPMHLRKFGVRHALLKDNDWAEHLGDLQYLSIQDGLCHAQPIQHLIKSSPGLEILILEGIICPTNPPLDPVEMEFLRLQQIIVSGIFPAFIYKLVTPQLTSLQINLPGFPLDTHFANFCRSSKFSLHELVLRGCRINDAQILISLFADCPELRILEISGGTFYVNPVVESLKISKEDSQRPVLCPLLENVTFANSVDLRVLGVVDLVQSRLPDEAQGQELQEANTAAAPIKSLNLDGCRQVDRQVAAWFAKTVPRFSNVFLKNKASARQQQWV